MLKCDYCNNKPINHTCSQHANQAANQQTEPMTNEEIHTNTRQLFLNAVKKHNYDLLETIQEYIKFEVLNLYDDGQLGDNRDVYNYVIANSDRKGYLNDNDTAVILYRIFNPKQATESTPYKFVIDEVNNVLDYMECSGDSFAKDHYVATMQSIIDDIQNRINTYNYRVIGGDI